MPQTLLDAARTLGIELEHTTAAVPLRRHLVRMQPAADVVLGMLATR